MKYLILFLFFTPLSFSAGLKIQDSHIQFSYSTAEGDFSASCTHKRNESNPYEWDIKCADEKTNFNRHYNVHLALSSYKRATNPEQSYELLYWVTDQSNPNSIKYDSSTIWFHLVKQSPLFEVTARQYVENDRAGLLMRIKLPQ